MSRRALVTGSTGFIGGALTRRLVQDGWEVHCLVRPRSDPEAIADLHSICRLHTHDGSTGQLISIMREANPDIVFHLASLFVAEHQPENVEELVHSNVLFSTQVVEAMISSGCKRLVNTGTSWQHYHTTDYRPVNLYAATKQAFEDILVYYHDAQDLSVITLKLFDTYGPGDPRRKLLSILVDAAASGERLDISPGDQTIDLTHVDDVARAFLTAAQILGKSSEQLHEHRFVSGERYTVRELVRLVEHASGRTIDSHFGGRTYRSREVMIPVVASEPLPGWRPAITLMTFLERLSPAGDLRARRAFESGVGPT